MPILNPFATDAFNMYSMGAAIERLPNNYGKLREMALFPEEGITTRYVMIDELNGRLNLLQSMPVGSPGQKGSRGTRTARGFTVPHIPHDDNITSDEYAGVRAFGMENALEPYIRVVNNHLQSCKNKHSITLEHLRMGALKGTILDADGTTIYDLYTEFVRTKKIIDFELDDSTTNIPAKCTQVKRHIEQNLLGETMTRVHCLVDETFWDMLISHPSVEEIYARWRDGEALRTDMRSGLVINGVTFEEYAGTAPDASGTHRKFITTKYGHAFPIGTQSLFKTYFAPADFIETVNTMGRPYYAKMQTTDFERGVELHTQSNPLPLCHRPECLVTIYTD